MVECLYELEAGDLKAISAIFGEKTITDKIFKRETYYGKRKNRFILPVNDAAALAHLADNAALSDDLKDKLKVTMDWNTFAKVLDAAEATEAVNTLKELVNRVRQHGLDHYVFNQLVWPRAPKFLYFDEYYQMTGRTNLNALIVREHDNQLIDSDYPLLGLINLARLDLGQLVEVKNTAELKNKLEGAGNHLTRRIITYHPSPVKAG